MAETPRAPDLGSLTKKKRERVSSREQRTALVIGGMGSFGAGIVNEHVEQGRPVRALVRDVPEAVRRFGSYTKANFHEGDVFDPDSLREAARGCSVIYHAVGFPMSKQDPAMRVATENIVACAKEAGAAIVFPGNVWSFGPQHGSRLAEIAETHPDSKKGRLRLELEERLREATKRGDARVLIVRSGDLFGPTVRNAYHDGIFKSAMEGKGLLALGSLDAPHQFAYVPDLARVCIKLSDAIERLVPFETFHFAGHTFERQQDFYGKVIECAEDDSLKVKKSSWLALRGAGLVNKDLKELIELKYLWEEGVLLDDTRLRRVWPKFALTPIEPAIARTLASYR
ncbi:unnamed protein product [Symbiodinium necroappetens]|uniref:NAD-dependent epimerase/dehydratase domain-containing protein n=1 Tax=Symbiodinium necroappetens TaxID=1628268 RepID=A0A813CEJ0_9DINO|nr:unnamed protein product [Symbiodinium necroappetens]